MLLFVKCRGKADGGVWKSWRALSTCCYYQPDLETDTVACCDTVNQHAAVIVVRLRGLEQPVHRALTVCPHRGVNFSDTQVNKIKGRSIMFCLSFGLLDNSSMSSLIYSFYMFSFALFWHSTFLYNIIYRDKMIIWRVDLQNR